MDYIRQIEHKWGTDNHKSQKEIRYCCPFCLKKRGKADRGYSFSVNRFTSKYQCFKCGTRGQLCKTTQAGQTDIELVSFLQDMFIEVSDEEEQSDAEYISFGQTELTDMARRYLIKKRRITEDDIEYYNICCSDDPSLVLRVIVPNELIDGFTDMYVARSYSKYVEPKYMNPDDSNKANVVFNLFRLPQNCDRIICCEGVFSSIAAGRDSVCCYGSKPSKSQVSQIVEKNPKEFIACLDNDLAGYKSNINLAIKIKQELPDCKVSFIPMPKETDPADMGHQKFLEYLEANKVPVSTDNFNTLLQFYSRKIGEF